MPVENPRKLARRATSGGAPSDAVLEAQRVLTHQAATLGRLVDRIDESFAAAVEMVLATQGHVVVSGVGKSGLIGRKIASTLACTGTPALYISASEAHHGDLGMITAKDTVILISYSGETDDVVGLIPHLRDIGVPTIAFTGKLDSSLARNADLVIDVSVEREACPNNLAPTTSTLAALAIGDALAIALMRERSFTPRDFARYHPGGSLGRRLLTQVRDVMRRTKLPCVAPTSTVGESLITMTEGRLGLVLVMHGDRLVGLITDGDLRRAMQRHPDVLRLPVSEIMTQNPVTIDEHSLLGDAHHRMTSLKLKALVALNSEGKVTGVIEVFDLDGGGGQP